MYKKCITKKWYKRKKYFFVFRLKKLTKQLSSLNALRNVFSYKMFSNDFNRDSEWINFRQLDKQRIFFCCRNHSSNDITEVPRRFINLRLKSQLYCLLLGSGRIHQCASYKITSHNKKTAFASWRGWACEPHLILLRVEITIVYIAR